MNKGSSCGTSEELFVPKGHHLFIDRIGDLIKTMISRIAKYPNFFSPNV